MTTNPESLLAVTQEDWSDPNILHLADLLAREGHHSGVWFGDELIRAAGLIRNAAHRLATRPAPPAQPGREEVVVALRQLADDAEAQLCQHDDTHRGGAIWTICDECGRKWADDEGGFVPYETPAYIKRAREIAAAAEPLLARQDWPKELDASASMPVDFERRYEVEPAQDVRPEAEPVARADNFNGSTAHLLDCIDAFLDLTDDKAFVPHNLDKGSHAYRLLVAARVRLEASIQSEAKTAAALVNALAGNAPPATLPTVREERLREALEHTRDELVRLAWDENHPLIDRIEAALSTEEPKL